MGASRSRAAASASRSRSMPTRRASGAARSKAWACPPRPSVPSTRTAPGSLSAGASSSTIRSSMTGVALARGAGVGAGSSGCTGIGASAALLPAPNGRGLGRFTAPHPSLAVEHGALTRAVRAAASSQVLARSPARHRGRCTWMGAGRNLAVRRYGLVLAGKATRSVGRACRPSDPQITPDSTSSESSAKLSSVSTVAASQADASQISKRLLIPTTTTSRSRPA